MNIKALRLGQVGTNCYIIEDGTSRTCAIIDPADSGAQIAAVIKQEGWTPAAALLTHSHFDHILGIPGLRKVWPDLPVYCHPLDMAGQNPTVRMFGVDVPTVCSFGNITPYEEGQRVAVGALSVEVLHTPGHTPGSVTLRVVTGQDRVLFTGDTLFAGSMGRTDLPGGDEGAMMRSLARLANLEGDYRVCPGHEGLSTLYRERKHNSCVTAALARTQR